MKTGVFPDRAVTRALLLSIREGRVPDVQVILFSRELGKLRVRAPGVKKPNSRIASKLAVGNEVEVNLVLRRTPIYTSSEVLFHCELPQVPFAHFLCEATDLLTAWQLPDVALYAGLKKALRLLSTKPPWEVCIGYLAYLLKLQGYEPKLNRCGKCHKPAQELERAYLMERELFCGACARGGVPLSKKDWLALHLLFAREKVYRAELARLMELLQVILTEIAGEPLRSLSVLLKTPSLSCSSMGESVWV